MACARRQDWVVATGTWRSSGDQGCGRSVGEGIRSDDGVVLPVGAQKYRLIEDVEVDGLDLVHAPSGPGLRADRLRADRASEARRAALRY
jgi:hypothetical protein